MTSSNYTTLSPANPDMAPSSSDVVILSIGVVLAALYLFRDQLFSASKHKPVPPAVSKQANGSANPRDFIAKMKEAVSTNSPFFLFFVSYSVYLTEETPCHILRFANRYCRRVCYSSCQRSKTEIWPSFSRLRPRGVRF